MATWSAFTAVAHAEPPTPVAEISATVSSEVQQDQVQIVLSARVTQDSAAKVNQQLNQMVEAARTRLGQPEGVRISTGGVQTYPNYDQKGKITNWQGKADIILQSSDVTAAASSADKVSDVLAVSDVTFSLSDQARRQEQARLMDSVANAFREKAATTARVFGYTGFQIQKLNVTESGESPSFRPMMMAAVASDSRAKAELNLVPGIQMVSVTVGGLIELR